MFQRKHDSVCVLVLCSPARRGCFVSFACCGHRGLPTLNSCRLDEYGGVELLLVGCFETRFPMICGTWCVSVWASFGSQCGFV